MTSPEFDRIKRDLEEHVLAQYPELKQRRIVTADRQEKKQSKKAAEMKRQNKKMNVRDGVRNTILKAMMHTTSLEEFHANLAKAGYEYYSRGKHHGVTVTQENGQTKKYRFATVGVHESFEEYLGVMESFAQAQGQAQGHAQGQAHADADSASEAKTDQNGPEREEDHTEETQTRGPRGPRAETSSEEGEEFAAGEKEKTQDNAKGQGSASQAEREEERAAQDTQSQQDKINPEPENKGRDFWEDFKVLRAKRKAQKAERLSKRRGKPRR